MDEGSESGERQGFACMTSRSAKRERDPALAIAARLSFVRVFHEAADRWGIVIAVRPGRKSTPSMGAVGAAGFDAEDDIRTRHAKRRRMRSSNVNICNKRGLVAILGGRRRFLVRRESLSRVEGRGALPKGASMPRPPGARSWSSRQFR
jgi:hypothetical protein